MTRRMLGIEMTQKGIATQSLSPGRRLDAGLHRHDGFDGFIGHCN
jgi:hypothetical protein